MFALALNNENCGQRLLVLAVLDHKIRVNFIAPIPLYGEGLRSDQVAVPPEYLGMVIEIQSHESFVPIQIVRHAIKEGALNGLVVIAC